MKSLCTALRMCSSPHLTRRGALPPVFTVSLLVVACGLPRILLAQSPEISRLVPAAVTPGKSVDVTIHGKNLASPSRLWTSFHANVELVSSEADDDSSANHATYRITVPRQEQAGVGALRLATNQGVSNLQLFMLDDLPNALDGDENHEPENARVLNLPIAVDGACQSLESDYFRFRAQAGDFLSVDVIAQRIGSQLDASVRVLDANGREMAFSDDEPSTGADSRLRYRFEADGWYLIEIRDIRNQGGEAFYYRLRLGDFPLATAAYPLGGRAGTISTFDVTGPAVDGISPLSLEVPHVGQSDVVPIGVRFPGKLGCGFVTIVSSDCAEVVEAESNDTFQQAESIHFPCAVNGRFQEPKDRDYYQFDVKKGQRYLFTGRTRDLGSPCDLFMRLLSGDGKQLAEAEDVDGHEGILDHTFSEDGTYYLSLEDLLLEGGPTYAYRIEIREFQPGFSLEVEQEKFNVPRGGTFVAKVTSKRQGYDGPINLSVKGIGEEPRIEKAVIAEGKNDTELTVTLPPGLEPGQLRLARIVGRAEVGGSLVVATANTRPALSKFFPRTPNLPHSLDGIIALGVIPEFPPFFEFQVESEKIFFPQLVATSDFKIKLTRLDKQFDAPVSFVVDGLPNGVVAQVKPVGKGETEYVVTLTGPSTISIGDYEVSLAGTGTFRNQTKTVVLSPVPMHVVKPLLVSVEPAGPIAPGRSQRATIRVVRFGDAQAPVSLRWKSAPHGISGPIEMTIPPELSQIEVELSAASDTPLGKFNRLAVVATTTVAGQQVVVESPPSTLHVRGNDEPERHPPQE